MAKLAMVMRGDRLDDSNAQRQLWMGMENEALSKGDDDVVFTPDVESDQSHLPDQPVEAAAARPRKLVALHWLTVFCLFVAAALILTRDQVSGRALKMWLLEGHRHFGLFVLVLFLARVGLRIRLGKLPSDSGSSRFARLLATLTHVALYALLLAQPLLGWALSDAQGKPVHLLGVILPALVGADEDLADALQVWHQDLAWVLLGLISLHVAAALWHHFVQRDGVLRMMLPQRRR
jgi:cytochrome b561